MSRQCAGITRSGTRCTVSVDGAHEFCHLHDPSRAEERRRAASKAGKSSGGREVRDLKKQLQDLAAGVLSGDVDRSAAIAVNQIINTRARLIELERKVRETDELEARIRALEEARRERGRTGTWG